LRGASGVCYSSHVYVPSALLRRSGTGSLAGYRFAVRRYATHAEARPPLHFDNNRPPQNGRPPDGPGNNRRRRSRRGRQRFDGPPAAADIFAQPEFPQPVGPPVLSAQQLTDMSKTELNELAKTFDILNPVKVKKDELVEQIVEIQAQRSGLEVAAGVLDVLPEGYGFLRRTGYLPGADDIYISQSQIRRFELRRGDLVAGQVRKPKDNEKYYGIVKVETVNGFDPEAVRERKTFDELTAVHPTERFNLEVRGQLAGRAVDLFAPIGKGQRVLIAAPPKTGKTTLLKQIANAIATNHKNAYVIAILIDERPEDVTDLSRTLDGEVVASTFDEHPENHITVAELVLERAKRLVELGQDVVIVLDSITRLVRAYSGAHPPSGRPLGAGLETGSLFKPKRYFGAARKTEEAGSLTMIATVFVDTGAKIDDTIYEEFRGAANGEIALARTLAEARMFPAIDVKRSGTRHEEMLLSEIELRKVWMLRRATVSLSALAFAENVLDRLAKTKNNDEFLTAITEKSVAALV
jgi:transcription termination factor Rho